MSGYLLRMLKVLIEALERVNMGSKATLLNEDNCAPPMRISYENTSWELGLKFNKKDYGEG